MGRFRHYFGNLIAAPYALVLWLRHKAFDTGLCKSYAFDTPTLCVGNLSVGGTGKTSMVQYLIEQFKDRTRVAVLSRGYKRKTKYFRYVELQDKPARVGDEPLMIKKKYPEVIVAVDVSRVEGMRRLRRDYPDLGLVILDDAFQYRPLKARTNIILIDYAKPLLYDCLLPVGSLRDLPSQLRRAQAVVITKCPDTAEAPVAYKREFWFRQPVFFTKLAYAPLEPIFPGAFAETADLNRIFLQSKQAIVVSGIAKSALFVREVQKTYQILVHLHFGDHHAFSVLELLKIRDLMQQCPTLPLITTEKDAIRLRPHQLIFEEKEGNKPLLLSRFFYLPVKPVFFSTEEEQKFLALCAKGI